MANIFHTGTSGLLASQRAIATTSHNIANANTEGFSRQRVNFGARPAEFYSIGYIGQGVQTTEIERVYDNFVQERFISTTSEANRVQTYHEMIGRIDTMMSEENAGLAENQSDFFDAIQDLNTNPTSVGARQSMLNAASNLVDRFNGLQGQFDALQIETNNRIHTTISDINSIAQNISELNNTIVRAGGINGETVPSDLLDQRDLQISELAKRIDVTTIEEPNGSISIVVGKGLTMVANDRAMVLSQVPDPTQPEKTQIALDGPLGPRIISDQLTGGGLGGLLDFRRQALDQAMNDLGRLATVLADKFNEQHVQGLTMEGDIGSDFFVVPTIIPSPNSDNTGSASLTVTLTDSTALTTSDYKLKYDGATYTLTRLSDNETVTGSGPFNIDGIQIDIAGVADSGDSFLIRPTRRAAREFALNIGNIQDIALASPIRSISPVANLGTGEVSAPSVTDINDPALTDVVEIRFNDPATTFDVVNTATATTLASGIAYVKGDDISYQGWTVQISGQPDAGDTFIVQPNTNGIGDNRNGQLLAAIQNEPLIEGTSNLQDGYGSFVSRVGSNTRQAKINDDAMTALLQEAEETRASVSGVNLDEEAINLTRYQQSYQASAQVISAAEELFQILLNTVSR